MNIALTMIKLLKVIVYFDRLNTWRKNKALTFCLSILQEQKGELYSDKDKVTKR
jgi:hypothetical protein